MLHIGRNIFPVHKVVIEVKLRNFSVELMKITPFNGSNFLNGSKPFLGGSGLHDSLGIGYCPSATSEDERKVQLLSPCTGIS